MVFDIKEHPGQFKKKKEGRCRSKLLLKYQIVITDPSIRINT